MICKPKLQKEERKYSPVAFVNNLQSIGSCSDELNVSLRNAHFFVIWDVMQSSVVSATLCERISKEDIIYDSI